MSQLITVDRATLEQLVEALEEVSDYINRYSIPAHQLELDPIDEAITAGRAALANAERAEPTFTNMSAYTPNLGTPTTGTPMDVYSTRTNKARP